MSNRNIAILDLTDCQYLGELHKRIKVALEFPDHYGENWDAFWDCITDINGIPLYIEIHNFNVLEENLSKESEYFINILKRLKHYGNDKYYDITIIKIQDGENEYYIE